MRTQFTSPSVRKRSTDSSLYGRLSIIRFSGSIALLAITVAIVFIQNGSHSTVRDAVSPSEFSSGMPLP